MKQRNERKERKYSGDNARSVYVSTKQLIILSIVFYGILLSCSSYGDNSVRDTTKPISPYEFSFRSGYLFISSFVYIFIIYNYMTQRFNDLLQSSPNKRQEKLIRFKIRIEEIHTKEPKTKTKTHEAKPFQETKTPTIFSPTVSSSPVSPYNEQAFIKKLERIKNYFTETINIFMKLPILKNPQDTDISKRDLIEMSKELFKKIEQSLIELKPNRLDKGSMKKNLSNFNSLNTLIIRNKEFIDRKICELKDQRRGRPSQLNSKVINKELSQWLSAQKTFIQPHEQIEYLIDFLKEHSQRLAISDLPPSSSSHSLL